MHHSIIYRPIYYYTDTHTYHVYDTQSYLYVYLDTGEALPLCIPGYR